MLMVCERDCTGDPIVNGEKTRRGYWRGQLYDIDEKASWAIHFKGVSRRKLQCLRAKLMGLGNSTI